MNKMIFVSRHAPTGEQAALAAAKGFEIVHVGDVDAFDGGAVASLVTGHPGAAICAVHPAVFMTALAYGSSVFGCFENGNRAKEGEKPSFYAKALHIWTVQGRSLESGGCGAVDVYRG